MIIKAKYPKIGDENYSYGVQGIGSIYGGNHESTILEIDTEHSIVEERESSFPE